MVRELDEQRVRPLYTNMVNTLEAEAGLKGVILTSGKETFFAGGDLKRLVAIERINCLTCLKRSRS